jgi:hypothetical protein
VNDKERILMNIINRLYSTMVLAPNPKGFSRKDFIDRWSSGEHLYVHIARYQDPKPGDLVLCKTMNVNDWKIGWYVQCVGYSEAMIREIGTQRICHVSNEDFAPIVGMPYDEILEGDEYVFYRKVLKAFYRGYEFNYRFGGVTFDGRDATIWVREAFGGLGDLHHQSKPFPVPIHWNKKTTIKSILQTMRDHGYGTRKFERGDDE